MAEGCVFSCALSEADCCHMQLPPQAECSHGGASSSSGGKQNIVNRLTHTHSRLCLCFVLVFFVSLFFTRGVCWRHTGRKKDAAGREEQSSQCDASNPINRLLNHSLFFFISSPLWDLNKVKWKWSRRVEAEPSLASSAPVGCDPTRRLDRPDIKLRNIARPSWPRSN